MAFSIKISGLNETVNYFSTISGLMSQAIASALNHAGESVAKFAENKAPKDTGRMASRIDITKKATADNLEAVIEPLDKYATFVEKGTRPHFPPVNALQGWASRHGISPYAVAVAISKKGTKAQPFMKPAAEVSLQLVFTEVNGAVNNVIEKTK